uniref:PH domain-containing protein n=1 Tax=Ditylenchus dipsaci TaxID=166011 RepID=A0A915DET9_9BILA
MLGNSNAVYGLISDKSYDRKLSGFLYILQEDKKWRKLFSILKANLLFMFNSENSLDAPALLIMVEDCLIELADDNQTGKPYSFSIKFKTTGRILFLQQWISNRWEIGYHFSL